MQSDERVPSRTFPMNGTCHDRFATPVASVFRGAFDVSEFRVPTDCGRGWMCCCRTGAVDGEDRRP